MEKIEHFFDLLNKSNITLIGYSFKQEKIKDDIISKIPHIEIEEISSSFCFKSFLRDIKINEIFNDKNVSKSNNKWILLDINNIRTSSSSIGERQKIIKKIASIIQSDIICTNYKLLILSPMYTSPSSNINSMSVASSFSGGSTPLYMSDIVVSIIEDENIFHNKKYKLNIIKNRFGDNKKISLDGLENYNYICDNYPHFIKSNETSY